MSFFDKLFGKPVQAADNKNKRTRADVYEIGLIEAKHRGSSKRYSRTAPNGNTVQGIEINFARTDDLEPLPLRFQDHNELMGNLGDHVSIIIVKLFSPDGHDMGALPCFVLNRSTNQYYFIDKHLETVRTMGINHQKYGWSMSFDTTSELRQEIIWNAKERINYDLN